MINSDDLLRVAHLSIMGNEKCSQYHQGKVTLNESEICAGSENIVTGPCEVKREVFFLNKEYVMNSTVSHVCFVYFSQKSLCTNMF